MFNYGNIKSFTIKIVLGLSLTALSMFIFLILFSYNAKDPGFGVTTNSNQIINLGG